MERREGGELLARLRSDLRRSYFAAFKLNYYIRYFVYSIYSVLMYFVLHNNDTRCLIRQIYDPMSRPRLIKYTLFLTWIHSKVFV